MQKIPFLTAAYRAYDGDNHLIGHAEATLPNIQFLTETVKGGGLAGEIEMPILGMTQSMTASIAWPAITADILRLTAPTTHELTLRSSRQQHNPTTGRAETVPVTVRLKVQPKQTELGKLEDGAKTDSSMEFEVLVMTVYINNTEQLHIDKLNCIFRVQGEDYLAGVRGDVGLNALA